MKMKSFTLLFLLTSVPFLMLAGEVTPEKAIVAARNFYSERFPAKDLRLADNFTVAVKETIQDESGRALYYHLSVSPGGFVLVSATDAVIPVLGYAFEGEFSREMSNVKAWMGHYEEQIRFAIGNNISASADIRKEWDRLTSAGYNHDKSVSFTSVEPLLISKWNQDKYYNGACPPDPEGPDGRCYAGCVATAMGQLQYYYRFPQQGQGSYSYIHPEYGEISADFGATTYNWDGMTSSLATYNSPVANLLFHQGVSVDMDYGPDGSGMWNHKAAYSLKTYFRYGPETQYYFRDSVTMDWDSILIANLDQRKPLYYAGWAGVQSTSGHAFVCDGYQGTDYFHFNWGWGGTADGYFYLNNLTPGGNNFNFAQEVIPMFPDTIQNAYPTNCAGTTVLTGVRGSLEDGSGWFPYLSNRYCKWLIAPQDPEYDSVTAIKLTFLQLETEENHDIIHIYDGDTTTDPLIGSFSGTTLPPSITSSGNRMLIVFESDNATQHQGWIADYESVFPVYCSGTSVITEPSGELGDGSGNKNYINSSLCKWKIQPADAGAVTLTFTDFDLPDSLDMLRIFDQATSELLATLTGTQLPDPVTSNSGKMLLMFFTSKSITGRGWEAYYTSSLVGSEEVQKAEHFSIFPNPADQGLMIQYVSGEQEELYIEFYSSEGIRVYSAKYMAPAGMNKIYIDTRSFRSGLYVVKLSSTKGSLSEKVIIH